MELSDYREQIDAIDQALVTLYLRRMEVVDRIAVYKHEKGLPIRDPAREEVLLDKVAHLAGPEHGDELRALYTLLLSQSRARQAHDLGIPPERDDIHDTDEA